MNEQNNPREEKKLNEPILYYRSNSNTSRIYCQLLLEQLGEGRIMGYQKTPDQRALDTTPPWICFISPITLGTIELLTRFLESTQSYEGRIIIGAVGISQPREGMEEELTARHLSYDQRKTRKIFYLQGGYNQYQLGFVRRFSLSLSAWMELLQIWKKPSNQPGEPVTTTNPPGQQVHQNQDHWAQTGKSLFIPRPELVQPMASWIRSIELD
jgi:hypothetical protein